jgi:Zn-dependent M32 family carboxypeptidase
MENPDTQLALASQHFVNQSLQSSIKHYHRLPFAQNTIPSYLTKELEKTHQRTVWAMVKRNGDWDPSIKFLIGYASRAIAQQQSEKALGGFKELLTILLDNPELATTHTFIKQLLNNIDQWHNTFLNEIEDFAKLIFQGISTADFWEECLEIYGQGLPFRQMVIAS